MRLPEYAPLGVKFPPQIQDTSRAPGDLEQRLAHLKAVERFGNLQGLVRDNTFAHTVRCSILAQAMVPLDIKRVVERALWIHDIPEIEAGDTPVVMVSSTASVREKQEAETAAARNLLGREDLDLFNKFMLAGRFLAGETTLRGERVVPAMLVATVIDSIEGNMFFHYSVVKALLTGRPGPESLNKKYFEWSYRQAARYHKNLRALNGTYPEEVGLCNELLQGSLDYIRVCWFIPNHLYPRDMRRLLGYGRGT